METQPAPSAPSARERILALLGRVRLSWRERCIVEAILALAREDGRCYRGDAALREYAGDHGFLVAEGGGFRGYQGGRFRYFHRPYFYRVRARLLFLGLVRLKWHGSAHPGAARPVRVLWVDEAALRWCIEDFPRLYGRRWNSRRDSLPTWARDREDGRPRYVPHRVRRLMRRDPASWQEWGYRYSRAYGRAYFEDLDARRTAL